MIFTNIRAEHLSLEVTLHDRRKGLLQDIVVVQAQIAIRKEGAELTIQDTEQAHCRFPLEQSVYLVDDEITVILKQPHVIATGDLKSSCDLLVCMFRYCETLKLSSTILQHHNGNLARKILVRFVSFDHANIVFSRGYEVSLDCGLPLDFRE